MAQVDTYIDPDAGGIGSGVDWANAYTSMNVWESTEQTDLVTDTDNHVAHCRSSGGTADTVALEITGWTTSAAFDIVIQCETNDYHDGKWDATKYRLAVANSIALIVSENFVSLKRLQIQVTAANAIGQSCLDLRTADAGAKRYVEQCIFKGHGSAVHWQWIITINDVDADTYISNTVVYDGNDVAIRVTQNNIAYIYNVTIHSGAGIPSPADKYGIRNVVGTTNCKNVIADVNEGSRDFKESGGILNCDYCSSGDDTADDFGGAGNRINQAFTWIDSANGDYHLDALDTGALDHGVDLSGDGNYPISVDIDNVTRVGTWDIGADEYVVSAVGIVPQIQLLRNMNIIGILN